MKSVWRIMGGIALALPFFSASSVWAEKVEIAGIYYHLNGDGSAEVTCRGDEEDGWMYYPADELYVGDLTVPGEVEYEGKTYVVKALGDDAFAGSKYLTSILLPSSLTSVGSGVFTLCNGLEYISVDDMNPTFISQDGILYKRNPLTLNFVPRNIGGDVSLLDGITTIPSSAFQNCSRLTTIELPDEVTTISDGAFNSCTQLSEIFMGEKVESIGEYAFSKCSSLTIVNFPTSVKSIKAAAFADCKNLSYALFHEGVESIGKMAFYNCGNLLGVQLPSTLRSIGENAFKECVSLDVVKNDSPLAVELGSTDHGYVAYYATQIIPDPQNSACTKNLSDQLALLREEGRWMVLNAAGQWVSIYTLNGQLLCHLFCTKEKEEIPVESPRVIAVLKER